MWWNSQQQVGFHTQWSWLNSGIIIFFQLTRICSLILTPLWSSHFCDSHTFLILTPFLLPYLVIIQNSTNQFATFSFYFMHYSGRGCGRQFSMYIGCFNLYRCSLQTCITLTKIVYKARSSEIMGCGHLQLGRDGIRELHRVVSCNSLPLSCGSVLILVAAYWALLWLLVLLLTTLDGSCDF